MQIFLFQKELKSMYEFCKKVIIITAESRAPNYKWRNFEEIRYFSNWVINDSGG